MGDMFARAALVAAMLVGSSVPARAQTDDPPPATFADENAVVWGVGVFDAVLATGILWTSAHWEPCRRLRGVRDDRPEVSTHQDTPETQIAQAVEQLTPCRRRPVRSLADPQPAGEPGG